VIKFNLEVRAVTLLTVGMSMTDVLGADVVVARKNTHNDKVVPYIPGPSMKGAVRTAASRVAPAYGFSSCGQIEPSRIEEAHKAMNGPCDVCRLFGYPSQNLEGQSKVYFTDLNLSTENYSTILITRVSLDDKTLSARSHALYTVEHLIPGTLFRGEVRVSEDAKSLLPLLLLGLAELRLGRIGRGSLVDLRIDDKGELEPHLGPQWKGLLNALRSWLWEGVVP